MPQGRLFTFVGFAIKSHKIIYGVDNIVVSRHKPYLVIYSENLGDSSRKKLEEYLNKKEIERCVFDIEELFPDRNCKAFGITDKHLAEAVKSEIKESRI